MTPSSAIIPSAYITSEFEESFAAGPELYPIHVLYDPFVTLEHAPYPIAVLYLPSTRFSNALTPIAVL